MNCQVMIIYEFDGVEKAIWELTAPSMWQALKAALSHIRICSRVEGLLLKKKLLNNGDSPETHALKVLIWRSLDPVSQNFTLTHCACLNLAYGLQ